MASTLAMWFFSREMDNAVLLSAVLQYSEPIFKPVHPPIFSFRVAEMRCSFDPLLREWLEYRTICYESNNVYSARPGTEQPAVAETLSDTGARRKRFRTLHDSVHSVSDKDKIKTGSRTDWSKGVSAGEDVEKNTPMTDNTALGVLSIFKNQTQSLSAYFFFITSI